MKNPATLLLAALLVGGATACTTHPKNEGNDSAADAATTAAATATAAGAETADEGIKGEIVADSAADADDGAVRVTLSALPTTRAGFESLRQQLGREPQGAVALELAAYELYRHNPDLGRECIALNNTESNVNFVVSRLQELLPSASAQEGREWKDDYYARPYLVMTFFDGATPANGYTPSQPLTLRIRHSRVQPDQKSEMLHGTVMTYEVYSSGYDTPWREVQVVQPKGSEYFLVSNCPALYTQCKQPE